MADQDTPNPAEDPRDLARRLAEEAKAKQLARQLVEQAKAKSAAAARPPVVEQAKRSLAERTSKPVSVEEALRRAIEEEKAAPAPKAAAPSKPAAPATAPAPAAPPAAAAPVAAPAKPVAPAPVVLHDAQAVLRERLPGVHVVRAVTVSNRVVFSALWQAHRARALADKDLALLVTSDALLDAATRVPEAALVAAHIEAHDGAWAVWVDASRPAMLGLARQPELLLAGL